MSTITEIREAIVKVIKSVPEIGQVHNFERYTNNLTDMREFYEVKSQGDGKILGWFIRRVSTAEYIDTSMDSRIVHSWEIQFYMSLVDSAQSEILFDEMIEAVRTAFRIDQTLEDLGINIEQDNRSGLQLVESRPFMFASVLCHAARFTLSTEISCSRADETGMGLDDFKQAYLAWDMADLTITGEAGPDGQIDAEECEACPWVYYPTSTGGIMNTIFIKPKDPKVKLRDPIIRDHIPAEGALVTNSQYWRRRIADGDAVVVKQPSTGGSKSKTTKGAK